MERMLDPGTDACLCLLKLLEQSTKLIVGQCLVLAALHRNAPRDLGGSVLLALLASSAALRVARLGAVLGRGRGGGVTASISAKKRSRRVSFFLLAYSRSEKLDCTGGGLLLGENALLSLYIKSSDGSVRINQRFLRLERGAVKMEPDEGPVFVVGMNGSGTTMLLDHLNSHSSLYGFKEETKVLPYFLKASGRYDLSDAKQVRRLWDEMTSAHAFRKANRRRPVPLPPDWLELGSGGAAPIFDYIMRYFAAREGKTRWCEKTPMHVFHMRELAQCFPSAKFIHIIRDGRDCAASFHRRWGYEPRTTMQRWKKAVAEGCFQGTALGDRYLEVFYEDLTRAPEPGLQRVCRFLDLPFEDGVLGSTRRRQLGSVIVPNAGTHNSYFGAKTIQHLERIGGRTLAELHYRNANPDSDWDPPWIRRRWWTFKDYMRLSMQSLARRLRSTSRRSRWKMFFAKLKAAGRQKSTNRF
jgi:hypothetical protein